MIRKFLFPLWGAEDPPEGDEGAGGDDPVITDGNPTTREMTAEEIENLAARAADRAGRKARKDLASELGFDDLSKLKDFVTAKVQADKDAMDDQARAIAEAEEAKREAEALRSNLASDRLDTAVLRKVVASGITDEKKISRVTALVRLDLESDVINDEDTWDEAITAALSAVKEDAPELFSGAKVNHGSGDGGAHGPSTPPGDEGAAREKKYTEQFAAKGFVEYDPNQGF